MELNQLLMHNFKLLTLDQNYMDDNKIRACLPCVFTVRIGHSRIYEVNRYNPLSSKYKEIGPTER